MPKEVALTIDSVAQAQRVLDVQGFDCPMPLLRAKLALGELASGEHLLVLATDPHSVMDFEAFCTKTGHQLLGHDVVDGVFRFLVRHK